MQVKSSISCFSFGVGGRFVVRRPLLIDPNPYTTPRNRRNTSLLISDAQPKHVCRCRADENKSPKLSSLDKGHQFPSSECVEWAWLPVLPHVLTASISNFLFGYHIGIMNGPIRSIAHELGFEGESITEGLVVSIFVAAAFIGSLSTGTLADMIGRRRTLQLDMLPFILGTLISANANTVNEMLFGRFLVGLGIGANTVLVPVYISENQYVRVCISKLFWPSRVWSESKFEFAFWRLGESESESGNHGCRKASGLGGIQMMSSLCFLVTLMNRASQ